MLWFVLLEITVCRCFGGHCSKLQCGDAVVGAAWDYSVPRLLCLMPENTVLFVSAEVGAA